MTSVTASPRRSLSEQLIEQASLLRARLLTACAYRRAFGRLGKGTVIWRPILLRNCAGAYVGDNVTVRHGARIELVTERGDQRYTPELFIGDGSSFEQNLHLTCAERIVIGRRVAVTENVGIFDIWHRYDNPDVPIVDQPLRTAPVEIGDGCLIGMGAVIMPGVRIGRQSVVAANAVVTESVPDWSVVAGVPARIVKRYDEVRQQWTRVP